MPAKKTASSKKSTTSKTSRSKEDVQAPKSVFSRLQIRVKGLLARRPHRSFRRTYRRDYSRPLGLPGYWSFTGHVRRTIWQNKKLFLLLALTYAVLSAILVGLASQDLYDELSDTLIGAGENAVAGDVGAIGNALVLLTSGVVGALNQTPTEAQRIFAAILGLLAWLTTIWLLRALMAGRKPKLRDGLYNAGAPFLSTLLVSSVIVVQLLPVALAAIGYSAATATGLLDGGVEAMLFWTVAGLLTLLSVYWISSSMIALVVVTLPGMYPMQALRTAGDLVVGRRIRLLLRLLWLALLAAVTWVVIVVPIILFDSWLKSIWSAASWVPIVPVAMVAMASLTVIGAACYVYLLYRKVVSDDSAPA